LIPLPLTGMETSAWRLSLSISSGFDSFTPHGDGNLQTGYQ